MSHVLSSLATDVSSCNQHWDTHIKKSLMYCGSFLGHTRRVNSLPTLSAALQAMPHVRHLDLTDCTYFPSLLASLPELCPQLESLRLGGFKLTLRRRHRLRTEQEAVKALLQSLPRISHTHVQECWEDEDQPQVCTPKATSCMPARCTTVPNLHCLYRIATCVYVRIYQRKRHGVAMLYTVLQLCLPLLCQFPMNAVTLGRLIPSALMLSKPGRTVLALCRAARLCISCAYWDGQNWIPVTRKSSGRQLHGCV